MVSQHDEPDISYYAQSTVESCLTNTPLDERAATRLSSGDKVTK